MRLLRLVLRALMIIGAAAVFLSLIQLALAFRLSTVNGFSSMAGAIAVYFFTTGYLKEWSKGPC
jgi:hypothetical protein